MNCCIHHDFKMNEKSLLRNEIDQYGSWLGKWLHSSVLFSALSCTACAMSVICCSVLSSATCCTLHSRLYFVALRSELHCTWYCVLLSLYCYIHNQLAHIEALAALCSAGRIIDPYSIRPGFICHACELLGEP